MDPISQGTLGAVFSQSFAKKNVIKVATICGLLGGMSPDLDIFIRSQEDTLLGIEYHRHFTHSLFFIPIGSFIIATLLWGIFLKKNHKFLQVFFFTFLGYATHGCLDACTSYGTSLYWPFTNYRVTWNAISIIDVLFTVPLLIFVISALIKKSTLLPKIGFTVALSYLSLGFYHNTKVSHFVHELAKKRGHEVQRIFLNPTLGNIVLWRSVYQFNDKYYIDAVRVSLFSSTKHIPGESIPVIYEDTVFPDIPEGSVQRKDIKRFSHFSKGFIYLHKEYNNVIADLRYGTLPYDSNALWGIQVNENTPNQHVRFSHMRKVDNEQLNTFFSLIKGSGFE